MSDSSTDRSATTTGLQRFVRGVSTLVLHVLLPIAVLCIAALVGWKLLQTPPRPERQPVQRRAPLVEVRTAELADEPVSVYAAGVVRSAQQVDLKTQVGGKIEAIAVSLEPGARFNRGNILFEIESSDYEIAVQQVSSALSAAKARVTAARQAVFAAERDLSIELANAEVAKREYELFGDNLGEDEKALVLRVPQLAAARAAIDMAKADIETAQAQVAQAEADLQVAELNLSRTKVPAPFDAVVVERLADEGDTVTSQTPLARLIGTNRYWVELAVPESELKWIELPRKNRPGSAVHFTNRTAWPEGAERIGEVIRIVPTVDDAGRMAKVLCEIRDPLSIDATAQGSGNIEPSLLVGSYLTGRIEGIQTQQAVVIPRDWVREGDEVWVLTDDSTLSIRKIKTVYRSRDHLLVSHGVESGERVVTTDLATPVDGMELRLSKPVRRPTRETSSDEATPPDA